MTDGDDEKQQYVRGPTGRASWKLVPTNSTNGDDVQLQEDSASQQGIEDGLPQPDGESSVPGDSVQGESSMPADSGDRWCAG